MWSLKDRQGVAAVFCDLKSQHLPLHLHLGKQCTRTHFVVTLVLRD